jgi:hypothetical protein
MIPSYGDIGFYLGEEKIPAELGKVTLKSNGDEALSDESP